MHWLHDMHPPGQSVEHNRNYCSRYFIHYYIIAKLLLGNPVVDVTLFKIEFCTKICVGFLGTYP